LTQDQPAPDNSSSSITQHLRDWKDGDPAAAGIVISELYTELRRMAARMFSSERAGHTLQPTALVGELYLRLASGSTPDWRGRTHFFAVAAGNLRRILIEHARAHRAARRGGGQIEIPLDLVAAGVTCSCDDLLIIDEALVKLEEADPRAARVTELRFFGGLTEDEIAKELDVAEITVKRDWKFARAWLAAHLRQSPRKS
jgi:RNA polymerase sigma factor (TIGR02999 family)